MADTITILDGSRYATSATTDIWTINSENQSAQTANTEVAKSYYIALPPEAITARVLFNNNYDSAASRVHVKVRMSHAERPFPPKRKESLILAWTAVAAQAFQKTADIDLTKAYSAGLHIECAISSTTAHDGTQIIVQIKKEAGINSWSEWSSFIGPTGTAVKSDCSGVTAAGETVIGVTNPTTGGLAKIGKRIFKEDTDTIAQCEMWYLTATSGD